MKKILSIGFLLLMITITAQNKQILYGFDKIPQTLLLNPGAETTYKYHIGVPMLSGLSVNGNISGITVADVFRDDGIGIFAGTDFNVKFREAINKLGDNDYVSVNTQIEALNGGYKINRRDYLSVGFYSELDVFVTLPKDGFILANEGNSAYLNKDFPFSQGSVKADVVGVLHAGISRKFNSRFTAGARLKLYSGSANITSTKNTGTFTTRRGANGIYENTLSDVNIEVNSSGILDEEENADITFGNAYGGTFFGGNFGVGFDVGFTYYLNEQTEITGSVLDVGFINYSKNTRNYKVEGNYTFSGIDFKYDETASKDYWRGLKSDLSSSFPREKNTKSYSVMRPIKVNSAITYRFGKSRNEANCHDISYKDFYDNSVGGQLYTVFRPNGPRFALTGFYERKFSKHLNTKVTYTVDDFSYTNFGIGVSANIWKVNVYGMVDNIFELADVADAHTASFQLGVNLIFN